MTSPHLCRGHRRLSPRLSPSHILESGCRLFPWCASFDPFRDFESLLVNGIGSTLCDELSLENVPVLISRYTGQGAGYEKKCDTATAKIRALRHQLCTPCPLSGPTERRPPDGVADGPGPYVHALGAFMRIGRTDAISACQSRCPSETRARGHAPEWRGAAHRHSTRADHPGRGKRVSEGTMILEHMGSSALLGAPPMSSSSPGKLALY